MSCWAVIPLKAVARGKSRLRGALPDAQRVALIRAMAAHVAGVAAAARGIDHVAVVGPDPAEAPPGTHHLRDIGLGLNPALEQARRALLGKGATGLVILPGDLPHLLPSDVAALAAVARLGRVAIAPDRAGTGTNALALAANARFAFAFGPMSFARHRAEAARLGRPARPIATPTLAFDLDLPKDLLMLDDAFFPAVAA